MFTLRVFDRRAERAAATRSFPFRGVTIGRGLACDVVLEDPSVSRDHALLWQEGTGFHLRVLGRYGTQVAGREIAVGDTVEVEPEAEIRIGAYSLFVERPAGEANPARAVPETTASEAVERPAGPSARRAAPPVTKSPFLIL